MKVLFLGTGSAGIRHRKDDDKNVRTNSSILIDDCILIDPGPGVPEAFEEFNVDATKITYVLNSHRHGDHFDQNTLSLLESWGARFVDLKEETEAELGKYNVRSLRGNHSIECFHFIISDGNSRMFYGLDGAWLMYNEVKAIKDSPVDFAIIDATVGFIDGDFRLFEHNNLNMVIEIKRTLGDNVKRFCISHIGYTLHDDHEIIVKDMKKHNIEVAYDGMTAEF